MLQICSSKYWFNYRHNSNALAMYGAARELGLPDDRIVLMLADDPACNARNPHRACVYNAAEHDNNVYVTRDAVRW